MNLEGNSKDFVRLNDLFQEIEKVEFIYDLAKNCDRILYLNSRYNIPIIELAEKGLNVFVVTPSDDMIDLLEKKIDDTDIRGEIELQKAGFADFHFDEMFSISFFLDGFDYITTDKERIKVLKNINKHLDMGGKLIFDLNLSLMDEDQSFFQKGSVEKDGKEYKKLVSNRKITEDEMISVVIYKIFEDGELLETVKKESEIGLIKKDRIYELLEKTGLEVIDEYSDYSFEPFEEEDDRCILVVRKVGVVD